MCISNYWDDIVETRDFHRTFYTDADLLRGLIRRRKLGLPDNAPDWLHWRVTTKPPGPTNRGFRREARVTQNRIIQKAIAHGMDWNDVIIESRPSRLDNRGRWY